MTIGKIIKELRINAGYKQKDFASTCNISPSFLSQIESGARLPHENTLKEISAVLQVPVSIMHFLTLSGDEIPEEKRELFEMMFPPIKAFMAKLFPAATKMVDEKF